METVLESLFSDRRDREVSWIAHLPGIELQDPGPFPLGTGRIERVPFETWAAYDSDYDDPAAYEESRPVFFAGEAVLPDSSLDSMCETVLGWREDAYLALLLASLAPLPHPRLSCCYIRGPGGVRMEIGAAGREWILAGSYKPIRFPLSAEAIGTAAAYLELLDATRAWWTGSAVSAALDVLALTGQPEFNTSGTHLHLANQFVHCIAAAEALLLPPKKKEVLLPPEESAPPGPPLTDTFGRHAAILLAPEEERKAAEKRYAGLYSLRSKLIHGQERSAKLLASPETLDSLVRGRAVLVQTIGAALTLAFVRGELPRLYEILPEADRDPSAYAALRRDLRAEPAP